MGPVSDRCGKEQGALRSGHCAWERHRAALTPREGWPPGHPRRRCGAMASGHCAGEDHLAALTTREGWPPGHPRRRCGAMASGHCAGEDHRAALSTREAVSYTLLRAHETVLDIVCRLPPDKITNDSAVLYLTVDYFDVLTFY